MTRPVAICAGSTGGEQPSCHGPTRQPTRRESAPPRKGRGTAVGAKMLAYFHKHGEKLKVEFDEYRNTYKSFGEFGAWYDSHVGSMVRDLCEPYHDWWFQVPEANKDSVKDKVLEYFDMDLDYKDGVLSRVLDRDSRLAYNEWKSKLHKYFKENGGETNLNAVKAKRPVTVRSQDHWDKCCTRFISNAFKDRSKRTSGNRAKHKFDCFNGRVSLTSHGYKMGDKQNKKPASAIVVWGDKHKRKGNWPNARAEQAFNALSEREARAKSTMAASTAVDTTTISLPPDEERVIMEGVLGTQRGFMTGIGPTVSRPIRSTLSSSSVSMEEHQRVLEELKDMKDAQTRLETKLEDVQTKMIEQVKEMHAYFAKISSNMTSSDIQVPSPCSSGMSPHVCDF